MQIRASKLARKHFCLLLHPEPCPKGQWRQDPLNTLFAYSKTLSSWALPKRATASGPPYSILLLNISNFPPVRIPFYVKNKKRPVHSCTSLFLANRKGFAPQGFALLSRLGGKRKARCVWSQIKQHKLILCVNLRLPTRSNPFLC